MAFFSQIYNLLCTSPWTPRSEKRVLIMGIDSAGKTTILYRLKCGRAVTTIPTIGFNVETINYKNMSLTVWDLGGRSKSRPLWRHYYQSTEAIMFVVDSTDRDRIDSDHDYGSHARDLFHEVVNEDELKDAVFLVWANKQDLPNALSAEEVAKRLGVDQLKNRKYKVFECVATTGEGLYDGLNWLSDVVNGKTYSNGKYSEGEKFQLLNEKHDSTLTSSSVGEYFRSIFC